MDKFGGKVTSSVKPSEYIYLYRVVKFLVIYFIPPYHFAQSVSHLGPFFIIFHSLIIRLFTILTYATIVNYIITRCSKAKFAYAISASPASY